MNKKKPVLEVQVFKKRLILKINKDKYRYVELQQYIDQSKS
jgi:hypothetical protein